MADIPYMPMFVDDYEAATAHLSLAEDGAYSRLLRLCWRTPGCSIPSQPEWIMRHMRIDRATYDEVVAPIIREFFKVRGGRVVSKRLREEFEHVRSVSKARKDAGKKGGKAKALKNADKNPDKATDLPEQKSGKTVAPIPIYSVGKPTDAAASEIDPVKAIFDEGVALLSGYCRTDGQARGVIGRWRKARGDEWTLRAIRACRDQPGGVGNPIEWIEGWLRRVRSDESVRDAYNSEVFAEARRMREAEEQMTDG